MKTNQKKTKDIKKPKIAQDIPFSEDEISHVKTASIKYFFMSLCGVEVLFILCRFILFPTANSQTFISSFLIILAVSAIFGFGLAINLFKKQNISGWIPFGLCMGLGGTAVIWSILIVTGCPLNPYLFILAVFAIAGGLIYKRQNEVGGIKRLFNTGFDWTGLLAPLCVLFFAFIILSLVWLNSKVPTDVDCQSDSFCTLMILKEGTYPVVSPYLDNTRLEIKAGPVFHTFGAVISRLKNSLIHKEVMAVAIISGSFFCLAMYYLASFIIKNRVILFLAGILPLIRGYLSFFNDGNLVEQLAFYYAVLFIIFLFHTLKEEDAITSKIFAITSGICLAICELTHPMIFMYNAPVLAAFFFTIPFSKNRNLKRDYIQLIIITATMLIIVIPYLLRTWTERPEIRTTMEYANTLTRSVPYWHGYLTPIIVFIGSILLIFKRDKSHIFLLTYLIVIILFIFRWRVFQLFSPSWFRLEPLSQPWFGAYYQYANPFDYPRDYHSAWFGGVIIYSMIIAYFINYLYELIIRSSKLNLIRANCPYFLCLLVFCFIGFEFVRAKRYPEFILESDYAALDWVRENTAYDNTLVYAPMDDSKENAVPRYFISFWVPIVSERKSIIFRNYWQPRYFNFISIDKPIEEMVNQLQVAAYSLNNAESYKIIKDTNITHIFVSAFLAQKLFNIYNNSPFLELQHYASIPNQGTSLVYKVK